MAFALKLRFGLTLCLDRESRLGRELGQVLATCPRSTTRVAGLSSRHHRTLSDNVPGAVPRVAIRESWSGFGWNAAKNVAGFSILGRARGALGLNEVI